MGGLRFRRKARRRKIPHKITYENPEEFNAKKGIKMKGNKSSKGSKKMKGSKSSKGGTSSKRMPKSSKSWQMPHSM